MIGAGPLPCLDGHGDLPCRTGAARRPVTLRTHGRIARLVRIARHVLPRLPLHLDGPVPRTRRRPGDREPRGRREHQRSHPWGDGRPGRLPHAGPPPAVRDPAPAVPDQAQVAARRAVPRLVPQRPADVLPARAAAAPRPAPRHGSRPAGPLGPPGRLLLPGGRARDGLAPARVRLLLLPWSRPAAAPAPGDRAARLGDRPRRARLRAPGGPHRPRRRDLQRGEWSPR